MYFKTFIQKSKILKSAKMLKVISLANVKIQQFDYILFSIFVLSSTQCGLYYCWKCLTEVFFCLIKVYDFDWVAPVYTTSGIILIFKA